MTSPPRRLAPRPRSEWDETTRRILGEPVAPVSQLEGDRESDGGGPLNILRTIAYHPTLLEPFLGFAAALAARGVLPRRSSELLALRTAWSCRSPFEWAHHVVYGRAAGLDEAEIARIANGPDDPAWSDPDRELLRAADELHASQQLSDATWQLLRTRYDEAQLVEIPFVVGQYTMLSMVANATGVEVEPGLPELPPAGSS